MADSYNFVHCAHKVWRITKEKGPSETFRWTLQDKNLAFYHFIKKKKGDMPRYGGKWVFGQKYYRNEFLQKRCLNRLCDARNFERAVCRSLFYLDAYQHVLLRFMGQTGSSPTHTPIRAGTTQPSPRVYRGRNSHTFQSVLHFRLPSAPQRYNTLDFPRESRVPRNRQFLWILPVKWELYPL